MLCIPCPVVTMKEFIEASHLIVHLDMEVKLQTCIPTWRSHVIWIDLKNAFCLLNSSHICWICVRTHIYL